MLVCALSNSTLTIACKIRAFSFIISVLHYCSMELIFQRTQNGKSPSNIWSPRHLTLVVFFLIINPCNPTDVLLLLFCWWGACSLKRLSSVLQWSMEGTDWGLSGCRPVGLGSSPTDVPTHPQPLAPPPSLCYPSPPGCVLFSVTPDTHLYSQGSELSPCIT